MVSDEALVYEYSYYIANFTSRTSITNYINQKLKRKKIKLWAIQQFFSHNMAKNDFYIFFLRKERTRKVLFHATKKMSFFCLITKETFFCIYFFSTYSFIRPGLRWKWKDKFLKAENIIQNISEQQQLSHK